MSKLMPENFESQKYRDELAKKLKKIQKKEENKF